MKKLLRALGPDAPFGVLLVDDEHRVRHINPWLATRLGAAADAAEGRPISVGFPALAQALAQLPAVTFDTPPLRADGPIPVPDLPFPPTDDLRPLALPCGDGHLECFVVYPSQRDNGRWYRALFYLESLDGDAHRRCFVLAMQRLQQAQQEQHQLIGHLERANAHLLRSEKLAGIGQLAAGVAHEINNPVGYVFSNLKSLARYMQDFLRIIDAVDQVRGLDELRQLKSTLEYDYIRGDVEALINESEEGIDRVKRIIAALKDFSHMDEEKFRKADLHRGFDTTLNIINNELRHKAHVEKMYGDLPPVECNPSQINQVFMNLMINATHAMETPGTIVVRTGRQDAFVWFEVQDDGRGMDEATQQRIFEPFFTTKPVGQGTGLGLSLSYSIVRKHGGTIEVASQPGRGTRFRVILPIEQDDDTDAAQGTRHD